MDIINFALPGTGNFIVKLIMWLVSLTSSVTVAIILFTLILKLITLPFDYVSRSSMRKNSLKMEQMRPELEKLQKQYANDKALYNQKMMALYKKNGYSMFGSCLPTILTLVIFIVALNGFTDYSKLQNRQYFYNMSSAYNSVVYAGLEADGDYIIRNDDGTLTVKDKELYDEIPVGQTSTKVQTNDFSIFVGYEAISTGYNLVLETTNGYTRYKRAFNVVNNEPVFTDVYSYDLIEDKVTNYNYSQNALSSSLGTQFNDNLTLNGNTYSQYKELEGNGEKTPADFILEIQQQKSADKYREEKTSFLWVKNIWVTDSPMAHPVVSSWKSFKSTHGYPKTGEDIGEEGYANLTAKLEFEKSSPNGYFVLVVLTAGVSLLMQIILSKSQKAQMELQTVDGQGAQTQKIMTVMMPVMMAIFAFMYTSAFSIYIILSSVMSMLTTISINKIVDTKFKKELASANTDERIRGRVYTPKEEPKKEKPKKSKKQVQQVPDFLTGEADNKKKIRGRIK